jgi:hypothetical protein
MPARVEPSAIVMRLAGIRRRAAGSDAERRAAVAMAAQLRELGYRPRLETHWVRPYDALVHALHALLALTGGLVMVEAAIVGTAMVVAALGLTVVELTGAPSPTRMLTPRRATQNVVAADPQPREGDAPPPVRLIVTAALDAPRAGALSRGRTRRLWGRARLRLRGHLPGPHALALGCMLATAAAGAARIAGLSGELMGPLQIAPMLVLLLLLAGWLELWVAEPAAGAVDATGPAAALALAAALRERPLERLAVDVVLAGASDGPALGMSAFVAARRRRLRPEELAVIHIEPCATGTPRWWERDGRLFPLWLHPRLRALAAQTAAAEAHLHAGPHVSRGHSGALAARRRGWPALAVGCLDEDGHPSRAPEQRPLRAAVELTLGIVRHLDREVLAPPAPQRPRRPAIMRRIPRRRGAPR